MRGFTLMELMVTVSVTGVIALAGHALMLETRVSGARLEAEVAMQREASLAGEWLGRDLRTADAVEPGKVGVEIVAPGERRVRWAVEPGGLVRIDGAERLVIGAHVARLDIDRRATPPGWRVEIELVRPLVSGRGASMTRVLEIGDRR